jgi:hypothetical protein
MVPEARRPCLGQDLEVWEGLSGPGKAVGRDLLARRGAAPLHGDGTLCSRCGAHHDRSHPLLPWYGPSPRPMPLEPWWYAGEPPPTIVARSRHPRLPRWPCRAGRPTRRRCTPPGTVSRPTHGRRASDTLPDPEVPFHTWSGGTSGPIRGAGALDGGLCLRSGIIGSQPTYGHAKRVRPSAGPHPGFGGIAHTVSKYEEE